MCFLHLFFTCCKSDGHLKEEGEKECDVNNYMNTMCNGTCCTRVFVQKTSNVEECANICKEREKCRHYIWHYTNAPHTSRKEDCFVVDVEEGAEDMTYRDININTVSGSCKKGATLGPCKCSKERLPVCGVDGRTFRNYCAAECGRIEISCYQGCPCTDASNNQQPTTRPPPPPPPPPPTTTPPPETTTKKEKTCFAPTSTVETRKGVKTIPELLIGDEIRTSADNLDNAVFTEFLGWLERQESSPAEMLQIFTTDNTPAVTLSASHVVFASKSTKYAGDLVPGDTLLHWDGVQMKEMEITEIKTRQESGFWAPLTRSGTLLVDGFLMSCYASYPHKLADVAMTPIKAMPETLLDDEESQHMDGVRKSISFMKGVGDIFGARRGEDVFEKVNMNLGSFVNTLKYEF